MADQEINKKTIDDYKKDYEYYTGKASEIGRSLALGGIAVIWIFKTTSTDGSLTIPSLLIAPLIWLVISLSLDLLQYVIGGLIWLIYYRYKEYQIKNNQIQATEDLKAPKILPLIIHIIYWSKLISIIVSYCLLLSFLYSEFIAPISN
jgi:hypothetical protein